MSSEYSQNGIKTRIKEYWDGEIPKECIKEVNAIVSDFTDMLINEGIEEFNEYNRRREIQGLPKLKRLDASVFKNLSTKTYNDVPDFNHGELGQSNIDTNSSKAEVIIYG